MNKSNHKSPRRRDPLPEPEYFDEMFPEIDDMPDPWEDEDTPEEANQAEIKVPPPEGKNVQIETDKSRVAGSKDGARLPDAVSQNEKGETRNRPPVVERDKNGARRTVYKGPALPHLKHPAVERPLHKKKNGSYKQAQPNEPQSLEPQKPPPSTRPPTSAPRPTLGIRPPKIGIKPKTIHTKDVPFPPATGQRNIAETKLDWPGVDKNKHDCDPQEKPQWYVLEEVIKNHQPLPENALILGIDQDGKPMVLSLEEASPGGILIVGDSARDNRKHLQAILESAALLNDPKQVGIDVISADNAFFSEKDTLTRKVCQSDDQQVYELLGEYLEILEKRAGRSGPFPIRILVLDEVEQLVDNLAPESLSYLRWILRRGPQAGIWPIATLASERLTSFDLKTYRSFGLRLCGKITDPGIAKRYSNIPGQILKKLLPGSQACLKINEDVIQFSIPHF